MNSCTSLLLPPQLAGATGDRCRRSECAGGAGERLGQAARHVRAARAVADLGGPAEHVIAVEIVAAVVEVDIERWVGFSSIVLRAEKPWMGENHRIGAQRDVGDGGGAVAAHALAPQSLQADGDLLGAERRAEAAADACADCRAVGGRAVVGTVQVADTVAQG